jgi:hypothetical protein
MHRRIINRTFYKIMIIGSEMHDWETIEINMDKRKTQIVVLFALLVPLEEHSYSIVSLPL